MWKLPLVLAMNFISNLEVVLAFGTGGRRLIDATHDASISYDNLWDYDISYSWMIGKELNDPFYSMHPARSALLSFSQFPIFLVFPFSHFPSMVSSIAVALVLWLDKLTLCIIIIHYT
jgi:hypothetical protein